MYNVFSWIQQGANLPGTCKFVSRYGGGGGVDAQDIQNKITMIHWHYLRHGLMFEIRGSSKYWTFNVIGLYYINEHCSQFFFEVHFKKTLYIGTDNIS